MSFSFETELKDGLRKVNKVNIPNKSDVNTDYLKGYPCVFSNGVDKCVEYKDENGNRKFKCFNSPITEREYKSWIEFLKKCEIKLNVKRAIEKSYVLKNSIGMFNFSKHINNNV